MNTNGFYATGRLIRLNLRQHRIFLALWLLIPVLMVMATAFSSIALFPTAESLLEVKSTLEDPMVIGMHGRVLDISIAGYTAWRTKVMCSLFTAIFSFVMVIRHTRRDEEDGRRELLGSVCVGRHAPLAAALVTAMGMNMAMAVLILLGMLSAGLGFTGSLAHAFSIGASGCFFAAAAAVFSQIFTGARSATNMSVVLLAFLMVFHIGWNIGGSMGGLMYLSPLEWPMLIRSFAGENFAVLPVAIAIIAMLLLLSFKLSARRDVGAGFIPERTGRIYAKPGFRTARALSWRIQKGMLVSWAGFFGVIGFMLGIVSRTMADISSTATYFTEFVERLGGADRAFMSLMIYILSMTISIYPVLSIQRMRSEEAYIRAETVLALPVSRLRFCVSHMFVAFSGSAAIIIIMGLTVGIGAAITTGDPGEFIRLFSETVFKLPAVWVVGGIAALFFGLVPRIMTGLSFAVVGIFVLIEFFWEQQVLPDAIFALSPFSHVYPTNGITLMPVITLTSAVVLLSALGVMAFMKRDISSL
ncbi:MAG TPA: ABC transporter [Clostridia bacterium]|nr:ABC transporter [Clostridia bacterium]